MKLWEIPPEIDSLQMSESEIECLYNSLIKRWKLFFDDEYLEHFVRVTKEYSVFAGNRLSWKRVFTLLSLENFYFQVFDIERLIKLLSKDVRSYLFNKELAAKYPHGKLIEQLVREKIRYAPTLIKMKGDFDISFHDTAYNGQTCVGIFMRKKRFYIQFGNHRIAAHYLKGHKSILCCVAEIGDKPVIPIHKDMEEKFYKYKTDKWF